MHKFLRIACLTIGITFVTCFDIFSQNNSSGFYDTPQSTVIFFRTFNIFDFGFNYNLYMADSLIGRIRTHDVYMVDINSSVATLRATTKAPSLNADKRTKYKKIKSVQYPINLKSGDTYFVKCGFLNQNVFDLPRQPTLTLLKSTQTKKYLRKRFLREKIKDNLYEKWLSENGI